MGCVFVAILPSVFPCLGGVVVAGWVVCKFLCFKLDEITSVFLVHVVVFISLNTTCTYFLTFLFDSVIRHLSVSPFASHT